MREILGQVAGSGELVFKISIDTADGGVGIPIVWGTDAVHGHANVVGATIFPQNIGLGATPVMRVSARVAGLGEKQVRATLVRLEAFGGAPGVLERLIRRKDLSGDW